MFLKVVCAQIVDASIALNYESSVSLSILEGIWPADIKAFMLFWLKFDNAAVQVLFVFVVCKTNKKRGAEYGQSEKARQWSDLRLIKIVVVWFFLTNIMSVLLLLDELLDSSPAADAPRTCGWSAPPSRCARTSSMNIATRGQDRTRKCVSSPAAKRGLAGWSEEAVNERLVDAMAVRKNSKWLGEGRTLSDTSNHF